MPDMRYYTVGGDETSSVSLTHALLHTLTHHVELLNEAAHSLLPDGSRGLDDWVEHSI